MDPAASGYVLSSTVLAGAGLAIVAHGVRAYRATARRSMLHVSIGFTLVAATAIVTGTNAYVNGLSFPTTILLFERGLASLGVLVVLYSLIIYDADD
jgi:hypothetical protein